MDVCILMHVLIPANNHKKWRHGFCKKAQHSTVADATGISHMKQTVFQLQSAEEFHVIEMARNQMHRLQMIAASKERSPHVTMEQKVGEGMEGSRPFLA